MAINASDQRRFGRTGLKVSAVTLGTSGWGSTRDSETAEDRDYRLDALADQFFSGRLEITTIDTSNMYAAGQSERRLGSAMRRVGALRHGHVLQTKLDRDARDGDFSAARMNRSLEESLERLGLGRIQVLFLHDPETIGFEAAMSPGGPVEALTAMKAAGLASHVGISGGPVGMLQRFVETDLFDTLITHNRWTLVDRSADALLDAAAQRGMGIQNAAPYGGGVLTGDPRFFGRYGYRPIRREVQAAVTAAERLCAEAGISLGAAALQFSLRDPRIHSTIVGLSDTQRWENTRSQISETIPEELWAALEKIAPPAAVALDA